jgi:Peptidase family M28
MDAPFLRTAVCGLLLAAAAGAQTVPLSRRIAARLTANDLKGDVSFLASDALQGRGTPSEGLEIAAEYIAAQFRRAGLHPAGDRDYFQTAPFASVTPVTDGLELSFHSAAGTIAVDRASMGLQEAAALSLSGTAAIKVPSAGLDQLTAGQAGGKVLIVELPDGAAGRGGAAFAAMRRIPAVAAKVHAALVILLRANGGRGNAGRGNAGPRLREASTAAPVPVLAVWDPAARRALASAQPGPLEMTVSAHIAAPDVTPVKLHNVIGVLRGSDPALRNTYVLITAHYDHLGVRGSGPGDHIYNGANDDASGTACLIEMAETLAFLPQRPKRSIVFMALFGEELGLVGSRYYARHPVFPLARTVADLNLEQMGRTDDVTGPRVGLVNVTGYDYTSITPVLAKAGGNFGIRVVKDPASSDPFFARSDNQAFADAGVPAHTLSVGYVFPDYHQPGDEWPKLDYRNMARVDRTVALGVFRIADGIEAPQWNAANPKTARYVKAHAALAVAH